MPTRSKKTSDNSVLCPPLTRSGPWQLPTHTDSIGAGAIELAGARAPKFLTVGARGHNSIYGAPVKN